MVRLNHNLNSRSDTGFHPVLGQDRFRRGAVLVVVLVALTLLVGLLFFVLNVGDQVNRKVDMQSAADSVAVSGSGWLARSMNVVAMNNVGMARQIALVAVMDSLPVAAEMTIAEQTGDNRLELALQNYQNPGRAFTPYERDNFYRLGLAEIYRQQSPGQNDDDQTQLDLLRQIDEAFDQKDELQLENAYDVAGSTEWNSPDGRGKIWRAILAMDELSRATADSVGELIQFNADQFGLANGAGVAFVVPLTPKFPGRRTTFDDFGPVLVDHIQYRYTEGRVRRSGLVETLRNSTDTARSVRDIRVRGGAIPDDAPAGVDNAIIPNHRLGPFARLFRWRDHADHYQYTFEQRIGYTTFGPLDDAIRNLARQFGQAGTHYGGTVETSRFAFHLRTLATMKVAYMLGLSSPQKVQYSDEWISNLEQAADIAAQDQNRIMTTRYYRVMIKSTVPPDDAAHWLKPASWQDEVPTLTFVPRRWFSWELSGRGPYDDPSEQPLGRWILDRAGWRPIGNVLPYNSTTSWASRPLNRWVEMDSTGQAWCRKWTAQREYDRELQLPPRYREVSGPDNTTVQESVPYTIYYVEFRVFGGVELRNEILLSNPLDGAARSDLPAPILLDRDGGDYSAEPEVSGEPLHDQGVRREDFTFLGVAGGYSPTRVWPQRFGNANPADNVTAVAQAKVFNNKSWDLWTQDWQSELVPVTKWQDWTTRLAEEAGTANQPGPQDPDQVQRVSDYLETISPLLMDAFLDH